MKLSILNHSFEGGLQTKITEYDIKLFQDSQERMEKIINLDKDQQTKLAIDVTHLRNQLERVRKK